MAFSASCHLDLSCTPTGVIFRDAGSFDMWLGDTVRFTASPMSDPTYGCERDYASSFKDSSQFTFTIADPAVATVSASGLVTGLALGSTTVAVDWKDQHATRIVTVSPVVASIRMSATPQGTITLNDTVTIVAEALDAAGNVIPDAKLIFSQVFVSSSITSRVVDPIAPVNPRQFRFVAIWHGSYRLTMRVKRSPERDLISTVQGIVVVP